jgi:hypothetical protein
MVVGLRGELLDGRAHCRSLHSATLRSHGTPWSEPGQETTCLQLEKEMTRQNRHGRKAWRADRQTSPEGLEFSSEEDVSALGAALNTGWLAPVAENLRCTFSP